jgi:hypothetical protein
VTFNKVQLYNNNRQEKNIVKRSGNYSDASVDKTMYENSKEAI